MSPAKKFIFSFIAIVGIPALFFLALEVGLRLIGLGTHYEYFNELEINGERHYQDNKSFANQFYPPSLGVAPLNNTLKASPSEDSVRVYVLGGSAAQGFPHVNHGLDRHLSAHLSAALPNKTIEVINTAMTSVNSHVVYEVARTLPENSADYAVILMGNNEVVGPYGPSTFNQNFLSSLTLIRTLQALKRTRTWQAIAMLLQKLRPTSDEQALEWEGMQMFSGFSVKYDDPRLDAVYSHYEQNLRDIIKLLQDKNMHVIVSSVPVNLRHSAPFGSSHKDALSDADKQRWSTLNQQAEEAFTNQDWPLAQQAFLALLDIDDEYADTHFRLASVLEHLDEFEQAEQHFQAALKYDTKRFRTDDVLNDIIMKVADDTSGDAFAFVNSVEKFAKASQPNVPGWDLLHEHVHFDYAGNYVLARAFTAAIMADIKPSEPFTELASDDAAERIGFPNHETNEVMNRLLGMINKSPFTEQINHTELAAFTEARRDQIVKQVGSPQEALTRRQELIRQGTADWKIHYELAELNRFVRDREASAFHLKELIKQYPHNHESYIKLAELESTSGNLQQSIQYLEQSMYYTRNDSAKTTQALGWIGTNYMKLGNYSEAVRYFEQVIDEHSDQIGATMRAYGALIKFARDENQRDDFHHHVAGVKRYAKDLIAQDRVKDFPLLYRRMAQIMTIAEDKVEAQRWQSMQAEKN